MPKIQLKGAGVVKQSLVMSVQNIVANKMRSFLTTLGIIIGVMAVISLITIVEGVTGEMMNKFAGLGADVLTVSVKGTTYRSGLNEADMESFRGIENVKYVMPDVTLSTNAVRNGKIVEKVSIDGVNEEYFKHEGSVAFGRDLYASDMGGDVFVCVVDKKFCEKAFYGEDPIGKTVVLDGYTYKVVGIEKTESTNVMADMAQGSSGGKVIVPYRNAMKMAGRTFVNSLAISVENTEKINHTQSLVERRLNEIFNNDEDAYWVMNLFSILNIMDTMMGMMTGVLAGIAAISLVVGGIGIMNMMLVSVTERTKEIGLRKALGATPGRIQLQFLIEAFILSMAGGFVGMGVGLGISAIVAAAMGIPFKLSISAIQLGVGFSAAVGIVFGWAPAKKASELNPIDALRSE